MILTTKTIKTLLASVLEGITGLKPGRVIWEASGGPRPSCDRVSGGNDVARPSRATRLAAPERLAARPSAPSGGTGLYCSLWWKELEPLPQNQGDYRDVPAPDGKTEKIIQNLNNESWCTVQVSFWGPGALEAAAFALGALQNDNRIFDLWRVLGYGGVGSIQDISAAFGGRIQQRCFFDLSFYACLGADYPVDWFDASQWTLQDHHQGGAKHNESFTSPDV